VATSARTRYDADVGVIRYATLGDEAELVDVARTAYEASFGELWSPAALASFLARQFSSEQVQWDLRRGVARYLVAERDGELAGFARIHPDRPVTGLEGERGLHVQQLYLRPKVTGQGVGSALLDAAASVAETRGEARIWLEVPRSATAAIRLYERHELVRRIELPWGTDEREIGMWVMTRLLR
jgi:ribosomal protein S18 acetylase RimI-like enzyme